MTVCIVCAFDTYFERVKLVKRYYEEKGYEVKIISSSFSHRKKQTITEHELVDFIIPCKEYKKNLSVARLQNHYEFAKKVEKQLEKISPDIIYCFVPCNSLCKFVGHYRRNHACKLYFDILDLWPETMPIANLKNVFPFTVWKGIRNQYLCDADGVFCECDLFKESLPVRAKTLYFAQEKIPYMSQKNLKENTLEFCYLGSINNIIDIELIVNFLKECLQYNSVSLHVVGNGEKKCDLIQQVNEAGVKVIDHCEIYQQEKKQEIFDQCHYALNIMKPTVVVGLTMKSLDYLCGSLPLINTISADTKELVEKYNLGFNMDHSNYKEIAKRVSKQSLEEIYIQKENCRKAYLDFFTYEKFKECLEREGA